MQKKRGSVKKYKSLPAGPVELSAFVVCMLNFCHPSISFISLYAITLCRYNLLTLFLEVRK